MLNAKELLNQRFGKESQSISNVEVDAICKKLRELGVEVIERFPDKIEFEWLDHICSYKNRTFYCGTKGMLTIENISDLNTIGLDCLVGKLTDEQLNRVGNLIDLYDEQINHNLSLQEDMRYLDMFGTDMYANLAAEFDDLTELKAMLATTFQSRNMEDYPFSIKQYILKGE